MDDDIGWNDFVLRNYDPQTGKFIQQDPFQQFSSPYIGMGNDPTNTIDPTGGVGIHCPGISGLAIFLSNLGNAAGDLMSKISTVSSIVSITANAANTTLTITSAFKVSNFLNTPIGTEGVGRVIITRESAETKISILIAGGADFSLGEMEVSETTKYIANGIKNADAINIVDLDYFNYTSTTIERIVNWATIEYQKGNRLILYGYSAGADFLHQVTRSLNVEVELFITVDAADGFNSGNVFRYVPWHVYQRDRKPPFFSRGGPNYRGSSFKGIYNYNVTGQMYNGERVTPWYN